MGLRQTYVFFLIITTVGALLTIKICNTAYKVYDYSGDDAALVTPIPRNG